MRTDRTSHTDRRTVVNYKTYTEGLIYKKKMQCIVNGMHTNNNAFLKIKTAFGASSSIPAENHAKCDIWLESIHIFIFDILFKLL